MDQQSVFANVVDVFVGNFEVVADLFLPKLTAKPVNARRREIGGRAFCVYRLPGKGLRRFFRV
jgi:hypothetical protein